MWRVPAGQSENTTRFLKSVSKKIKSFGFEQNADQNQVSLLNLADVSKQQYDNGLAGCGLEKSSWEYASESLSVTVTLNLNPNLQRHLNLNIHRTCPPPP